MSGEHNVTTSVGVADPASIAWILTSAALVMLMTPGLAFFYGGMASSGNVLGVIIQNFVAMGISTLTWLVWGFSLAFAGDSSLLGNFEFAGLQNLVGLDHLPGFDASVQPIAFACFQMMFANICPALITGAVCGRLKFSAYCILITVWSATVYPLMARWVFSPNGWLNEWGALDFAGGLVVHINAGAAALALVILLGNRRGFPDSVPPPHNVPFVVLGAGILWFGWFGFNAGSALVPGEIAAQAFLNTHVAAAGGMVGWCLIEYARTKFSTVLGVASGSVAGLVAITPCAGFVSTWSSLVIGVLTGVVCFFAIGWKVATRFKIDDTADVIGIHLVGGIFGSVILGFFAQTDINPGAPNGIFFGGDGALLGKQVVGVLVCVALSFIGTVVIAKFIDLTIGLRVAEECEEDHDRVVHAESAYHEDHRQRSKQCSRWSRTSCSEFESVGERPGRSCSTASSNACRAAETSQA